MSFAPISGRLLRALRMDLIPYMSGIDKRFHAVAIHAQPNNNRMSGKGYVGTGISCGVDSLATVIRHGLNEIDEAYKINTLCLFNTGFYGADERSRRLYPAFTAMGESLARDFGYRFVSVDSNVAELSPENFTGMVTFLTNSAVLALQGLFHAYYFASSDTILQCSPQFEESSTYDLVTLPCISTDSVQLLPGCSTFTGADKLRLLLQNPAFLSRVYPCVAGEPPHNCGRCEKCRRTIMTFDAIGELEQAKAAFDISYYQQHRTSLFAYMLVHKNRKMDCWLYTEYQCIAQEFRKRGVHVPFAAWLMVPWVAYKAKLRRPLRAFGKKIIRCVHRR